MSDVPELTPTDVTARWPDGHHQGTLILLDVREPDELERASIDDARHIPMGEVPARLDELPKDKPIVVFCHMGGRSRRVAHFLAANGFGQVYNLDGGIEAWLRVLETGVGRN